MFKKILAALGTVALVVGFVAISAGPASAHDHNVAATCADGVTVNLDWFQDSGNHITVVLDGTPQIDQDLGSTFSQTFPWPAAGTSHSYEVKIYAGDDPDGTRGYTVDLTGGVQGCTEAAVATAVSPTDAVCIAAGTVGLGGYVIPALAAGVQEYDIQTPSGWVLIPAGSYTAAIGTAITIRALPAVGFTLTGTSTWPFTIQAPSADSCIVPTPPTPTAPMCDGPGTSTTASYVIPEAATGYHFVLDGTTTPLAAGKVIVTTLPSTVTIDLVVDDGYHVPADQQKQWAFAFTSAGDCLVAAPAGDPKFVDATCNIDRPGVVSPGTFTVFEAVHVHYVATVNGGASFALTVGVANPAKPGDLVVITPIADPGYVVSPIIAAEKLTHPFPSAALDCGNLPTDASWQTAVNVKQPSCSTTNGQLTVGDLGGGVSFFSEVDYFLDGVPLTSPTTSIAPGSYTVTASPHTPGDGLTGPSSYSITVAAGTTSCADLKTLALTGSSPTGWVILGYSLLVLGLALVAIRFARRRSGQV